MSVIEPAGDLLFFETEQHELGEEWFRPQSYFLNRIGRIISSPLIPLFSVELPLLLERIRTWGHWSPFLDLICPPNMKSVWREWMFSMRAMRTKLQDMLHLKNIAISRGEDQRKDNIWCLHILPSFSCIVLPVFFFLALVMGKHYLWQMFLFLRSKNSNL